MLPNIRAGMLAILKIRFVRFMVSGLTGVVAYYGIFLLFRHVDIHYQIAATGAAVCSILLNFFCLREWTFEDSNKDARNMQAVYFGIKKFAFYLLNMLTLFILVEQLRLTPEMAQAIAIPILGCFSFLIVRRIFAP